MRSRWLWITLAALAALVALAPIGTGFEIERRYLEFVERAGVADGVQIRGSIERGLWSSHAVTVIEVDDDPEPIVLMLSHELVHGPVPIGELLQGRSPFTLAAAVVDTRHHADPSALPRLAGALDGEPLARLVAWLRFDRSVDLRLTSPPLSLDDGFESEGLRVDARFEPQGEGLGAGWIRAFPLALRGREGELSLGAMELVLEMLPEGSAVRAEGTFRADGIELAGDGGPVRVEPISGRYSGTFLDGVLGSGEAAFEVGDVFAGGEPLLTGVRFEETWSQGPDTTLRAFETRLVFDSLSRPEGAWGPGELVLAVRNVDANAARDFRDAMQSLDDADGAGQRLLAEWMPRLLGTSPEAVLESLALASPDGELTGRGRIGVDGSEPEFLTDPMTIFMLTSAELELFVPEPMLNEFVEALLIESVRDEMEGFSPGDVADMAAMMRQTTLAQLVGQGLLLSADGGYRIDLRLSGGVPTLNGRLVDPSLLSLVQGG